jgi:hypothetical protein
VSTATNEIAVAFQPASRIRAVRRTEVRHHPARVARQLALAHALQARIDSGEFQNQAALARALGFSRERISKIMELLLLAPDIQEELLFLECSPGAQPIAEADLHGTVLATPLWEVQRDTWVRIKNG